jgi:GNAT superfamily N-acetyltransferase
MSFTIVPADLDDPVHARGIVEIIDSYARRPTGGSKPLDPGVKERLVDGLRAQSHARVWLAVESGRPIGVAVCFLGFSTFAARPLLNLHDFAVLPEHEGRGVGSALLEAVATGARELGCCKVTLEVLEHNDRALALYRRAGFGDFAPGHEATRTLFLEKRL